jgi:site-specific DNA-methyltransferase (adenine-specific)
MALLSNRVHQGDCIAKLKEIEAGSVDLVFADPPFNIGYEYDQYDDRRSATDYFDWCRQWMFGVHKSLKPTGTFWLAIGDEFAAELKLLAQNEVGFHCRSWVIWYYTFGVNCVRGFSRSHTHLFHFVKDPDCFTFNSGNPAVRVPSARQLVYADARANSKGRLPDNTWILRPQDVASDGFAAEHDTWFYSRVAGTFKEREGFHGCQMPEQLLGRIIRVSSHPRDLVFDPFSGSGTTLAVAKKLGRQYLGVELSQEYVARVESRLQECRPGDALDGPEDPVRSAPSTSQGKRRVRLRNGKPIPVVDQETEQGIVDAYVATCDGHSTDLILCDPELNARFVKQCKSKGLPGGAGLWNRVLLRIRKAGRLTKVKNARRRLTPVDMDAFSFGAEVAMQIVCQDYGLTLDELLCSPPAAATFDEVAAEFAPGFSPYEYRWAAMSIRKRAKRSKLLARDLYHEWLTCDLPRAVSLSRCTSPRYEQPGVYLLASHGRPLYVGETSNVKQRIERLTNANSWMELEPKSVRFLPASSQDMRHGLQSILIERLNPFLNSQLLRPDTTRVAEDGELIDANER